MDTSRAAESFRDRLLRHRGRTGLTQLELAGRVGAGRRTLQDWEAGINHPSAELLKAVIQALLEADGLTPGREAAEAHELWDAVLRDAPRMHTPFDDHWLGRLLQKRAAPPPVPEADHAAGSVAPVVTPTEIGGAGHPVERSGTLARRQDWGDAPDVLGFVGRLDELAVVRDWVVGQHCRVVGVLGIGGIGKTSIAAKLAQDVAPAFHRAYWRSLRNAPPVSEWLADAIGFLSDQRRIAPEGEAARLAALLELLRDRANLLVLDNFETLLEPRQREGGYRDGFAGYGAVLRAIGEAVHQSCLIVTSREAPPELAVLSGHPVRTLELGGLGVPEARVLLADKQLSANADDWEKLIGRFGGNGLALKVVGESIRQVFGGDIGAFLDEAGSGTVFGGIRRLLSEQIERGSALEQNVLRVLAVEREPVTIAELIAALGPGARRGAILEAVEALRRRSLVERSQTPRAAAFTLQSVVLEYVTDRVVEEVCDEIARGQPLRLVERPLIKAQAKDYVRQSQERLIGAPILQQLQLEHGDAGAEQMLLALLEGWRNRPHREQGYGPGNVVPHREPGYGPGNVVPHREPGYGPGNVVPHREPGYGPGNVVPHREPGYGPGNVVPHREQGYGPGNVVPHREPGYGPGNVVPHREPGYGPGNVVPHREQGYGPGNVVSLLRLLRGDLRGLDLGRLALRQAYLAGVDAQDASLAGAHLSEAVLAAAFNSPISVALSGDGASLVTGTSAGEVWLWRVADRTPLMAIQMRSGPVYAVALSADGQLLAGGSEDGTVRLWEAPGGRLLATLEGHTGAVRGLALSADGRLLASGSFDGTLRLWEVPGGRPLAALQAHSGAVWGAALSADGRLLASGGQDGTVRLWEAPFATGNAAELWAGQTADFQGSLASPPRGAVGDAVERWTGRKADGEPSPAAPASGVPVGDVVERWTGRGADGEPSPGGRLVATLQGHTGTVWGVSLSADGRLLASGGMDGTVRLWETHSESVAAHAGGPRAPGGQLVATLQGHIGAVWRVSLGADGQLLASGGQDGTVRLWETHTGRPLATLQGHTGTVFGVSLGAEGRLLASGGMDGTARLWEAPSGQQLATLEGHTNLVRGVALSADGRRLATGGQDGTVWLWEAPFAAGDAVAGWATRRATVEPSPPAPPSEVATGDAVEGWASRRADSEHSRAALPSGVATGDAVEGWARSATVEPSPAAPPSGVAEVDAVKGWARRRADSEHSQASPPSGGRLVTTLHGHTGTVWGVSLSADGRLLATGGMDGTVRLWDACSDEDTAGHGAPSGQQLARVEGHAGGVWSVALSADGRLLASGGFDGTVRLWDARSVADSAGHGAPGGQPLATLEGHTNAVRGVALSADGKLLASGSFDGTVRLWAAPTGQHLATLEAHTGGVWSVALSADGRLLASGGQDGTVRLWEAPFTVGDASERWAGRRADTEVSPAVAQGGGRLVATLHGHTGTVWGVSLSADGGLLASGGMDGTVRLWDARSVEDSAGHAAPSGRQLATLAGHTGGVWGVVLSADGRLLASGSFDGTVRLWDASSGAHLHTLRSDRRYERADITGLTGVTAAQRVSLLALGAIEAGHATEVSHGVLLSQSLSGKDAESLVRGAGSAK